MDLRIERTRSGIASAFLQLRAKKPVERITVTELAALAKINKATFYLHYRDIYDLSDQLENQLLNECLEGIPPSDLLSADCYRILSKRFLDRRELFGVLFSGSGADRAVHKLDAIFKRAIFAERPEWAASLPANVRLTALIYGCFHAFFLFQNEDKDVLIDTLSECVAAVNRLHSPSE